MSYCNFQTRTTLVGNLSKSQTGLMLRGSSFRRAKISINSPFAYKKSPPVHFLSSSAYFASNSGHSAKIYFIYTINMTLQSFLFLLGTATLTFAAPNAQAATFAQSPPLSEASAKAIFEHGDLHVHPDVIPNIVSVGPTFRPSLLHASATVRPSVSHVRLPEVSTPVVNAPGVPDTGSILVGVAPSIPLAKFSNESLVSNSSLNANSTLTKRQSCQYPNCCPDPRHPLNHTEITTFPYSVMGRWASPYESCSGTLVGPRHVLTASHCIDCKNMVFAPPY